MPEWVTLTRAARLVGVSRGMLQKRIQEGALETFEGKVTTSDLVRAYPQVHLEDNSGLERLSRIKDDAFARRVRERILPDPEILVARLHALSHELVLARRRIEQHESGRQRCLEQLSVVEALAAPALKSALEDLRMILEQELLHGVADTDTVLAVQDHFLRIMAAQVRLVPSTHEFLVEGNATILEAALRAGLALDYGCSNGNCGLCKARIVSGETKAIRHSDFPITEAERGRGYVLLCTHTAVTDLVVEAFEAGGAADMPWQAVTTRVKATEKLSDSLMALHLQTPRTARLRFLAGQSVQLRIGETDRIYPIASCPCDDRNLHFHLPLAAADPCAEAALALKPGDAIPLEGPTGGFVLDENSHGRLLFIAYELGFAPIKSLIEHAMALNTAESLTLLRVSEAESEPYLHNLCRSWADALDQFHYQSRFAPSEQAWHRILQDLAEFPALRDHEIYVSGPAPRVEQLVAVLADQGVTEAQLTVDYQPTATYRG